MYARLTHGSVVPILIRGSVSSSVAAVFLLAVRQHPKEQQGGGRGRVAVPADRRHRAGQSTQQPDYLASNQGLGRVVST